MNHRFFLMAVTTALFSLCLAGCEDQVQQPQSPSRPVASKIVPGADKSVISENATGTDVAEQPKPYVYDPTGRRDPFQPLVVLKRSPGLTETPLTPLQKFDIGQFKLIGVIIGKGESKAMIVAPDGKSYIVKRGISIGKNEGIVVKINPTSILVKERYFDFTGAVRESIQEIQLPKREGVE